MRLEDVIPVIREGIHSARLSTWPEGVRVFRDEKYLVMIDSDNKEIKRDSFSEIYRDDWEIVPE